MERRKALPIRIEQLIFELLVVIAFPQQPDREQTFARESNKIAFDPKWLKNDLWKKR